MIPGPVLNSKYNVRPLKNILHHIQESSIENATHTWKRAVIQTLYKSDQIKNEELKKILKQNTSVFKYNNLQFANRKQTNWKLTKMDNLHVLCFTKSYESSKKLLSCCFLLTPESRWEKTEREKH